MSKESEQESTGENQSIATKPGMKPSNQKAMVVVSGPDAVVDTGPVSPPPGGDSQPTQSQPAAAVPASDGDPGVADGGTVQPAADAGSPPAAVSSSGDKASGSGK